MVYPALFLCFLYATVQVHSCGMILHTDIVHRASLFYPHVISKHQDALQAGAVFPDWGYSFGNSEAAEGAHWEPFIVQAVNYIREKYGSDPNKWSDHAQKLVAFIYGVASHQISDINWHGLGEKFPRWSTNPGTGFLKTMGGLEFGCGGKLCQLAHTTGDVGGDFVVSAQMDVSWEVFHWYTPVNDIQNIYKLLHKTNFVHKVPKELTMMSAMAAMHVGMRAEKILSENVYPYYAYVSSFLAKNLQDHYIGGINDNGNVFLFFLLFIPF